VHRNSYLRNYWNIIDFIIALVSLLDFLTTITETTDLPSVKVIRTMRVLRPIRKIREILSLKKLIDTLLNSISDLLKTFTFLVFFMLLCGIIGIQTF